MTSKNLKTMTVGQLGGAIEDDLDNVQSAWAMVSMLTCSQGQLDDLPVICTLRAAERMLYAAHEHMDKTLEAACEAERIADGGESHEEIEARIKWCEEKLAATPGKTLDEVRAEYEAAFPKPKTADEQLELAMANHHAALDVLHTVLNDSAEVLARNDIAGCQQHLRFTWENVGRAYAASGKMPAEGGAS